MKYVIQKDQRHTLLLATNVPSSIFFGYRALRAAARDAALCTFTSCQILLELLVPTSDEFCGQTRW